MEKEIKFEVRDKRAKERFYLDDLYLNGYAKLCGIYATGVYLSLCRHSNLEQKCWPSIRKIAEELAISEKQVGRAVKILESYKIISKERIGKKATNRYWLLNKSEWTHSPISEQTTSPITTDSQSYHQGTVSPFHSKVTHKKVTNRRGGRFTPPSFNEVSTYCLERKNNIDAQNFIDFYSSKGWLIGKNKMKDWQAAIRTWESRNKPSVLKANTTKYDKFN